MDVIDSMRRTETLNIDAILKLIPHRYPFLLIDKVLKLVPGEQVVALKNVTCNEPFFSGHFPEKPVMPGVMIIEALAQATGILTVVTKNDGSHAGDNGSYYFAGIDKARFKHPVIPGDQLILEAKILKVKQDVWKFATEAYVGDRLACLAEITCAFKK